MSKKFLLLVLFFFAWFANFSEAAEQSKIEPLFLARKWKEIDQAVKSGDLSPIDRSVAANGYRLQSRWADVVDILGDLKGVPPSVEPYSKMALVIALENLSRKDEALKIALALHKKAPHALGYFVSYSVYRMSDDEGVKTAALHEMLVRASDKSQKAFALGELLKRGENKVENAKKLLDIDPSNSLAVQILSELPKPWSAENALLIGYAAYLSKENKRAAEILSAVPGNRKAQYYRAFALYNDKNYDAALKLLEPLAMSGNGYALTAATRISIISNKDDASANVKKAAKDTLHRIANSRKGTVQARALYSLGLHDRILLEYPSTSFALKVVWERGMSAWNGGNAKEALWYWQRANMPDVPTSWGARILYWTARAHEKLGQADAGAKTLNSLMSRYPLSVYTYLAKPGAMKLINSAHPSLDSKPTELERWGFLHYARINLLRDTKDAKNVYRAARISEWLGDGVGNALSLQKFFVKNMTASKEGLRLVYPRPYLDTVKKAAQRFGVEDNFVWSVMKQESNFNPFAKSHVGASGLMQLMPGTAKGEAGALKMQDFKIWDAADNITLGTSYLSRQLRAFGNPQRAAAAYNAGPGNARKWNNENEKLPLELWIEKITFDETSDYVQRVMGNLMTYRLIYGGVAADTSKSFDMTSPDNEEIEAQRAKNFTGTFNDTPSTQKEP